MAFPPSFIERLRSHFVLSELIARRMPLKKHGREFQGLCPFHAEKTPSFTVNNEKGFFHCFGCAAHGDAIEFIKRFDRLTYREAVEQLAREANIPVPQMSREDVARQQQQKGLFDATEETCRWFESNLGRSEYVSARDYLRTRGLSETTRERFRIGFAPDSRDGLKRHLLGKGFTEAQLVEAGLIIRPESGPTYDRFRARLMFPIRNPRGQIIAFGGRLIANAQGAKHLPKYLNSPETELFKKGEVLFNIDLAAAPAREKSEIIIVEGYMDAIAMDQAGIPHVVATLGTAVTPSHLHKLWQYAPQPTLCLDGDAAGTRAMLRAAELVLPLLKPGYSLRFTQLPAGEDPDSLIKSQGSAALIACLQEARRLSETLWRHHAANTPATAEGQAQLDHSLSALANRIENITVRNHYRSYFRRQIWSRTFGKGEGTAPSRRQPRKVEISKLSAPPSDARITSARQLLKISLLAPALLLDSEAEEQLTRMDCVSPALDGLRDALLAYSHSGEAMESAVLHSYLDAQGYAHAMQALLKDDSLKLPAGIEDSPRLAMLAWRQAVLGAAMLALETEYRALEQEIAGATDEAALARFLEIQRQLKELTASRNFSAFEPSDE